MKFSLVYENSGDSLEFDSINTEVLEYYVDKLERSGSNFFEIHNKEKITGRIEKLNSVLDSLNNQNIDHIIGYRFKHLNQDDCLNQKILNRMHADWVNSQSEKYVIADQLKKYNHASEIVQRVHDMFPDDIPTPPIGTVLSKLGLSDLYDSVNIAIHDLERSFNNLKYSVQGKSWIEFDNPFPKSILTNDVGHFKIAFHHTGRTLYNKFENFDTELECQDENSFDQLLGFVEINLQPAQQIAYSKEYTEWCAKHKREPIGNNLILGNIPSLDDKLNDCRLIIYRNLQCNNRFSIKLHRG